MTNGTAGVWWTFSEKFSSLEPKIHCTPTISKSTSFDVSLFL